VPYKWAYVADILGRLI